MERRNPPVEISDARRLKIEPRNCLANKVPEKTTALPRVGTAIDRLVRGTSNGGARSPPALTTLPSQSDTSHGPIIEAAKDENTDDISLDEGEGASPAETRHAHEFDDCTSISDKHNDNRVDQELADPTLAKSNDVDLLPSTHSASDASVNSIYLRKADFASREASDVERENLKTLLSEGESSEETSADESERGVEHHDAHFASFGAFVIQSICSNIAEILSSRNLVMLQAQRKTGHELGIQGLMFR